MPMNFPVIYYFINNLQIVYPYGRVTFRLYVPDVKFIEKSSVFNFIFNFKYFLASLLFQ